MPDRGLPLYLKLIRLFDRSPAEAATAADLYFCYRLLLDREPEPEGWQHWSVRVDAGMNRWQLVSTFLSSLEFRRRYSMHEHVRVELDGYSMFVDALDHAVSSEILHSKSYETHVTNALKRALNADSVFVDVGASIGWFTLLAARMLTNGKVIAIEPNTNNQQILYRSLAANGFENVVVQPYAATDKRALLQLAYDAAYGFVHSREEASDDAFVPGIALDELLQHEPRIDVIKMDIEGHEPVALRGMSRLIARHRPLLLSEFHPKLMKDHAHEDPAAYFESLHSLGYAIAVLPFDGGDAIPVASASRVMEEWQNVNAQKGTGDTMHLDLVARPAGKSS